MSRLKTYVLSVKLLEALHLSKPFPLKVQAQFQKSKAHFWEESFKIHLLSV